MDWRLRRGDSPSLVRLKCRRIALLPKIDELRYSCFQNVLHLSRSMCGYGCMHVYIVCICRYLCVYVSLWHGRSGPLSVRGLLRVVLLHGSRGHSLQSYFPSSLGDNRQGSSRASLVLSIFELALVSTLSFSDPVERRSASLREGREGREGESR